MMEDLRRREGESVYDYEDRIVRHYNGDDACLERTSIDGGGCILPYMLPCCLPKGHKGNCVYINPEEMMYVFRELGDSDIIRLYQENNPSEYN